MLCIDLLGSPRGLVSFANFLTPVGASRQVCQSFMQKLAYLQQLFHVPMTTVSRVDEAGETCQNSRQFIQVRQDQGQNAKGVPSHIQVL